MSRLEDRTTPSNVFPQFSLGEVGGALVLSNGNIVVWGDEQTNSADDTVSLYNGQTYALISTLNGADYATALPNGNFVAIGPNGTATWESGTTGLSGTVSPANSLVQGRGANGSINSLTDDVSVTPLTDGNYVVDFPHWDNNTGAVTWGNGTTGTTGMVSSANSLVGSDSGDSVGGNGGGSGGVTALPNGNYVVVSPFWNNDDGATTWANGTTGITIT